MTQIKVGDMIRSIGGMWENWYEVKDVRGDNVYLYASDRKMVFCYTISGHDWEIQSNEIDHFEYDGFRLPRKGEWFLSLDTPGLIIKTFFDFDTELHHIYRPIYKIYGLKSETPLTDKFEEEGW